MTTRALLDAQGGVKLNGTTVNADFFAALASGLQSQANSTSLQAVAIGALAAQAGATQAQLSAFTAALEAQANASAAQASATQAQLTTLAAALSLLIQAQVNESASTQSQLNILASQMTVSQAQLSMAAVAATPSTLCGSFDDPVQCAALLALLRSTDWKQQSFPTAAPATYCKWPEVTCGGDSGSDVVALSFNGKGYRGHLPPEIGNLTQLVVLDLHSNLLTRSLPDSLGALTQLTFLDVSNNAFSGALPASFASLTALQTLALDNNTALSGAIPLPLQQMTGITYTGTQVTPLPPPPPTPSPPPPPSPSPLPPPSRTAATGGTGGGVAIPGAGSNGRERRSGDHAPAAHARGEGRTEACGACMVLCVYNGGLFNTYSI